MSQLQLFETFTTLFNQVEQQLQIGHFPILLFKNIERRREIKENAFRKTQSTFIIEMNTQIAKDIRN